MSNIPSPIKHCQMCGRALKNGGQRIRRYTSIGGTRLNGSYVLTVGPECARKEKKAQNDLDIARRLDQLSGNPG